LLEKNKQSVIRKKRPKSLYKACFACFLSFCLFCTLLKKGHFLENVRTKWILYLAGNTYGYRTSEWSSTFSTAS